MFFDEAVPWSIVVRDVYVSESSSHDESQAGRVASKALKVGYTMTVDVRYATGHVLLAEPTPIPNNEVFVFIARGSSRATYAEMIQPTNGRRHFSMFVSNNVAMRWGGTVRTRYIKRNAFPHWRSMVKATLQSSKFVMASMIGVLDR